MKNKYIFIFLLVLLSGKSYSQNIWTTKNAFPDSTRGNAYGFSINNIGYVFSGGHLSTTFNDLWAYDENTDTWTQKATCPVGSILGGCFVINNKAYICLGRTLTNTSGAQDVWEYDPANDQWTQKNNFPSTGRYGFFSFVINNKGYIGNGNGAGGNIHETWEYDPTTDAWTQKSSIVAMTEYLFQNAFAIGDTGYVVGGISSGVTATNQVFAYNPSSDQWIQKNNFLSPIEAGVTFVLNNEGYILCGGTGLGTASTKLKTLYKYNASSDSWIQQTDFPGLPRTNLTCFTLNGKAYAGLGLGISSGGASPIYGDWAMYSPSISTSVPAIQSSTLELFPNPASNYFVINNSTSSICYKLFDSFGKTVRNIQSGNQIVYTEGLEDGIYYLKTENETIKLFITH